MDAILQQKRGKRNDEVCQNERVVVAVKASKEVPRAALVWALTHVVQPGDRITLLLVASPHSSGRKLWSFPRFSGDCATEYKKSKTSVTSSSFKYDLTDSCSHMIFQLRGIYDPTKTKIKIKIISGSPCGAVAAESRRIRASWVLLDKQLKNEEKKCMEELQCNIVIMNRAQPKILRLNLLQSPEREPHLFSRLSSVLDKSSERILKLTPDLRDTDKLSKEDYLMYKFSKLDVEDGIHTVDLTSEIELSRNPCLRPPLCSICKHRAAGFGEPPISFSYAELNLASGGFSEDNFLAEGGFGCVHRGFLADGKMVAIKQQKLGSSQGDVEFCSEVEFLSQTRHRNVVMLIGFCMESDRRLLVYEYVCNGSLNSHLHGSNRRKLEWAARQKIAVGAARGLRYLHEECRVGCIIHQDMRPNNILITHDFKALARDFGLARWKLEGGLGVEKQVIGSFEYLAPEYTQNVHLTEKADLYSFGVLLLELLTGKKAMDIKRPKGQHRLTEWIRPLLDEYAIKDIMDMYSKCGMIVDASPIVLMILPLLSSSLLNFVVMPRMYGVSKLSERTFPPKPGWRMMLLQDFELESSSF